MANVKSAKMTVKITIDQQGFMLPAVILTLAIVIAVMAMLALNIARSNRRSTAFNKFGEAVSCGYAAWSRTLAVNANMGTLFANCRAGQCVDFTTPSTCVACSALGVNGSTQLCDDAAHLTSSASTCVYRVEIGQTSTGGSTLITVGDCGNTVASHTYIYNAAAGPATLTAGPSGIGGLY